VLDGEIVAFTASGRPSFAPLQERVQLKTEREIAAADRATPTVLSTASTAALSPVSICAPRPTRTAGAGSSSAYLPSPHVQVVHAERTASALYKAALASGFEGVIAKRKDGRYESGSRSQAWLKIKPTRSAEFVVGGYYRENGFRAAARRPAPGYWTRASCATWRHVGSGFDDRSSPRVKRAREAANRRMPVCGEAGAAARRPG